MFTYEDSVEGSVIQQSLCRADHWKSRAEEPREEQKHHLHYRIQLGLPSGVSPGLPPKYPARETVNYDLPPNTELQGQSRMYMPCTFVPLPPTPLPIP